MEGKSVGREYLATHIKFTDVTLTFAISTLSEDFIENDNQV